MYFHNPGHYPSKLNSCLLKIIKHFASQCFYCQKLHSVIASFETLVAMFFCSGALPFPYGHMDALSNNCFGNKKAISDSFHISLVTTPSMVVFM